MQVGLDILRVMPGVANATDQSAGSDGLTIFHPLLAQMPVIVAVPVITLDQQRKPAVEIVGDGHGSAGDSRYW